MKTRTIKHKVFTYYVEEDGVKPDGTLGKVTLERMARRGEQVDLRDADANRGDKLGAFYTDAELEALVAPAPEISDSVGGDTAAPGPADGSGAAPDLASMSEEQVTEWLTGKAGGTKPSVPQVLNAVNAAPEESREEVAQKVLAAEQGRGDTDPRSTLVEPLEEFLKEED